MWHKEWESSALEGLKAKTHSLKRITRHHFKVIKSSEKKLTCGYCTCPHVPCVNLQGSFLGITTLIAASFTVKQVTGNHPVSAVRVCRDGILSGGRTLGIVTDLITR